MHSQKAHRASENFTGTIGRLKVLAKIQVGLINLTIMKLLSWNARFLTLLAFTLVGTAFAEPIEFSEVSLLVRAGESESAIIQEVRDRRLVRALTPAQEAALKKQGASDTLLQSLRAANLALPAAEAAAFDTRRQNRRPAPATDGIRQVAHRSSDRLGENLHIFEVSVGHPINLSQWGGPDYDIAFHPPTRLDEGREDAVLIDTVRTGTEVATYHGKGRVADSTTIFPYRDYASIMSYSFTRSLYIDFAHPVSMKGSPYILYPVYAAGGVSLYYIGATSRSVKLAVSSTLR